jgi:hypothetical protein
MLSRGRIPRGDRVKRDAVIIPRAPRAKKRMSCEINVNDARYTGIVVDVSASGLFVQTSVKPSPGIVAVLRLSLPGGKEPVAMKARVARKRMVPRELLAVAGGGVGFAIIEPSEAYLDYVAAISPEQAEAVARQRAKNRGKGGKPSGSAAAGAVGAAGARPPERAAGGKAPDGKREEAPKRFRIHAVETSTGRKNSFLVTCASEQEASDQVLEQLGDEWKVLFIERA